MKHGSIISAELAYRIVCLMLKYNVVVGIPAQPVYSYPAVCDRPPSYDKAVFGVDPFIVEKKTK